MNLSRIRMVAGAIALFLCAFIVGSTFASRMQRDVRPPSEHQIEAMKALGRSFEVLQRRVNGGR